jgi:dTDP-4-amino-4,6-dideoxygalactose transaminase
MSVPLVDLPAQHEPIRDELIRAFTEVLDSGRYVFGPELEGFEAELAQFCGSSHGIGVSSGTDALLLALMALGIGPGQQVIVPTFTFFATAGCVWRTGARPVFVDIDPKTCNLDPQAVERVITAETAAIIPVHLFGQCADMSAIMQIAARHEIPVIEDAAQALGARCGDQPAGSIGAVGCLSFFPSKNLGALGEGGMCLTSDDELAGRLRQLRHHGQSDAYHHENVGGNFRLDALQAALLRIKARRLDQYIAARREAACRYQAMLESLPVTLPYTAADQFHAFNYYTVRAPKRDELRRHLASAGIAHSVYYPLPLHLQPCFAELGYRRGDFPVSEQAAEEVISLPIYPELTEAQQQEVVDAIAAFYQASPAAGHLPH